MASPEKLRWTDSLCDLKRNKQVSPLPFAAVFIGLQGSYVHFVPFRQVLTQERKGIYICRDKWVAM